MMSSNSPYRRLSAAGDPNQAKSHLYPYRFSGTDHSLRLEIRLADTHDPLHQIHAVNHP